MSRERVRNRLFTGRFIAEYQNEPFVAEATGSNTLSADQIMEKINRIPRHTVPHRATRLTAFIDVQQNCSIASSRLGKRTSREPSSTMVPGPTRNARTSRSVTRRDRSG
jgi:hypothetical protein